MTSPRTIIRYYKIRPLKRLGQSFLIDKNVIDKIVAIADIQRNDVIVEIGAGLGTMTGLIAPLANKVIALEIDPYLVSILKEELKDISNIIIVQTDVLEYNFAPIRSENHSKKIKIVGNLPYSISSQILFRLIMYRYVIESMVLMLQKEMADRILSLPGIKNYGIPSVLIEMYATVSREMIVPGSCFFPKPKVDSVVLKFIMREKNLMDLTNEGIFYQLVKSAFSHRRKTLMNNIKTSNLLCVSEREARILFNRAGIDGNRRAETLSTEEFGRLSNILCEIRKVDNGI